ncbi:MAG: hypothetical protein EZS28_001371 [Streblomastix strix]|uniref:Uncharacterized protein n=1 Tax=Streblomastix strix TaxID=222440 RepID=A0A5J4X7S7_9EUKA|nr:MAG: hypothetical protein EZS28_001371 [Streblomastix strix]
MAEHDVDRKLEQLYLELIQDQNQQRRTEKISQLTILLEANIKNPNQISKPQNLLDSVNSVVKKLTNAGDLNDKNRNEWHIFLLKGLEFTLKWLTGIRGQQPISILDLSVFFPVNKNKLLSRGQTDHNTIVIEQQQRTELKYKAYASSGHELPESLVLLLLKNISIDKIQKLLRDNMNNFQSFHKAAKLACAAIEYLADEHAQLLKEFPQQAWDAIMNSIKNSDFGNKPEKIFSLLEMINTCNHLLNINNKDVHSDLQIEYEAKTLFVALAMLNQSSFLLKMNNLNMQQKAIQMFNISISLLSKFAECQALKLNEKEQQGQSQDKYDIPYEQWIEEPLKLPYIGIKQKIAHKKKLDNIEQLRQVWMSDGGKIEFVDIGEMKSAQYGSFQKLFNDQSLAKNLVSNQNGQVNAKQMLHRIEEVIDSGVLSQQQSQQNNQDQIHQQFLLALEVVAFFSNTFKLQNSDLAEQNEKNQFSLNILQIALIGRQASDIVSLAENLHVAFFNSPKDIQGQILNHIQALLKYCKFTSQYQQSSNMISTNSEPQILNVKLKIIGFLSQIVTGRDLLALSQQQQQDKAKKQIAEYEVDEEEKTQAKEMI